MILVEDQMTMTEETAVTLTIYLIVKKGDTQDRPVDLLEETDRDLLKDTNFIPTPTKID